MNTEAKKYQNTIQQKVEEIENEFAKYKDEIQVLNIDFSDICDRFKIIDQLVSLDGTLTEAKVLLSGTLLHYEIKTHLIVLLGNLARIYNKINYSFGTNSNNINGFVSTYETSIQKGKIKDLVEYLADNKDTLDELESEYINQMPSGVAVKHPEDSFLVWYTQVKSRFLEPQLNLSDEKKSLVKLFEQLNFKKYRDTQNSHLSTENPIDFENVNINFFSRPDFKELINKLDSFLNLLYGKLFHIHFIREKIGSGFVDEYGTMFQFYIDANYNKRKKDFLKKN